MSRNKQLVPHYSHTSMSPHISGRASPTLPDVPVPKGRPEEAPDDETSTTAQWKKRQQEEMEAEQSQTPTNEDDVYPTSGTPGPGSFSGAGTGDTAYKQKKPKRRGSEVRLDDEDALYNPFAHQTSVLQNAMSASGSKASLVNFGPRSVDEHAELLGQNDPRNRLDAMSLQKHLQQLQNSNSNSHEETEVGGGNSTNTSQLRVGQSASASSTAGNFLPGAAAGAAAGTTALSANNKAVGVPTAPGGVVGLPPVMLDGTPQGTTGATTNDPGGGGGPENLLLPKTLSASETYSKARFTTTLNADEDQREILGFLLEAAKLREKYTPCGDHAPLWEDHQFGRAPVRENIPFTWKMNEATGVAEVYVKDSVFVESAAAVTTGGGTATSTTSTVDAPVVSSSTTASAPSSPTNLFPQPSLQEYFEDMDRMFHIRTCGPVVSHCFYRLKMLRAKFELYHMVNYGEEQEQQKNTRHRDFYNVRKVDNHIHHAAAMNVKHLTRFMKKKFKKGTDDIVGYSEENEPVTLGDLAKEMGVDWSSLTINSLQMWTDRSCMHRFDRFNNKYMPMGQSKLRTLFLKTDNIMNGRYFAEITRELLDDLEEYKYQHTEWRLSIYGRKRDEWDKLAKWALGKGGSGNQTRLISVNNQWMIQIPRLFEAYKSANQLQNFQEMIDNIFIPLFEVTVDPESHPELEEFCKYIGAFDTVDDESKFAGPQERAFAAMMKAPKEWDACVNPSYKYYSYYIQTNMRVLNQLRAKLHLNQFKFRPHAGEAGELHHLDTAFLLADGINHGINLKKNPALQYLFYLCQIGISMSPCSNNQLFLRYDKNPFYHFFQTGLNVTLSTDDPLMFHQTKEPLLEEYAIAKQLWKLSPSDLCEVARNSVLQCSYPMESVLHWLGLERPEELYMKNSIYHTNVPDSRFKFRRRSLREEWMSLHGEEGVDQSDWEDSYQLLLLSPKARQVSTSNVVANAVNNPMNNASLFRSPSHSMQQQTASATGSSADMQFRGNKDATPPRVSVNPQEMVLPLLSQVQMTDSLTLPLEEEHLSAQAYAHEHSGPVKGPTAGSSSSHLELSTAKLQQLTQNYSSIIQDAEEIAEGGKNFAQAGLDGYEADYADMGNFEDDVLLPAPASKNAGLNSSEFGTTLPGELQLPRTPGSSKGAAAVVGANNDLLDHQGNLRIPQTLGLELPKHPKINPDGTMMWPQEGSNAAPGSNNYYNSPAGSSFFALRCYNATNRVLPTFLPARLRSGVSNFVYFVFSSVTTSSSTVAYDSSGQQQRIVSTSVAAPLVWVGGGLLLGLLLAQNGGNGYNPGASQKRGR
ncbi:unnamed protein product [Amoebophrya sp. A120]|nr:unnamed protein product [Amoebophrya sp. A120]|eukprot:GSA120T00005932001.1